MIEKIVGRILEPKIVFDYLIFRLFFFYPDIKIYFFLKKIPSLFT